MLVEPDKQLKYFSRQRFLTDYIYSETFKTPVLLQVLETLVIAVFVWNLPLTYICRKLMKYFYFWDKYLEMLWTVRRSYFSLWVFASTFNIISWIIISDTKTSPNFNGKALSNNILPARANHQVCNDVKTHLIMTTIESTKYWSYQIARIVINTLSRFWAY